MGRVEDKIAFITGAAHGQGREHALRLAQEGADVLVVDAGEDNDAKRFVDYPLGTAAELEETAALVRGQGRRAVSVICDVRDAAGLTAAAQRAVAELGGIDIVVANAGINTLQRWDEVTPQLWATTLDINLTGVWNTCTATISHLAARGGGSIVITSSLAGLKGLPLQQPYVAAKHALVGLARSLAQELAGSWVRVNTVHPTGVATPMTQRVGDGLATMLADAPELGALYINSLPVETVEAADISAAVLFLASDESRYLTGVALPVDAGAASR